MQFGLTYRSFSSGTNSSVYPLLKTCQYSEAQNKDSMSALLVSLPFLEISNQGPLSARTDNGISVIFAKYVRLRETWLEISSRLVLIVMDWKGSVAVTYNICPS